MSVQDAEDVDLVVVDGHVDGAVLVHVEGLVESPITEQPVHNVRLPLPDGPEERRRGFKVRCGRIDRICRL